MSKYILNQIINEELSLSGEVHSETIKIWKELLSILPNISTDIYSYYDKNNNEIQCNGVKFGYYSTKVMIYNEPIRICINLYNFITQEAFNEYSTKINYIGASSVYSSIMKMITLTIPMISGSIYMKETLYENLQHELEHIYQGKQGSKYITVSDGDYANARGLLYSTDKDISNLALIIYLSNEAEQDAFANGLYAYLESQEEPIPKLDWDVVKNSDAYIHYNNIKTIINKLQNPDSELKNKCNNYFNKSYEQLLNIAKNVEQRFIRKIGKILTKFIKDNNSKYNVMEYYSGKINTIPNYFIN